MTAPRRFFDSLYFACNPLTGNARILVQFVKTPNVLNILPLNHQVGALAHLYRAKST